MAEFIETSLLNKASGHEFPYAVFDKRADRFIGMTRYLRISEQDKALNIGWTWYSKEVWGTSINTESKYLLLKQAFESWNACRVELITTTNHVRSQRAIEKLGATREGVLRKKYRGIDYVVFSIIDDEWLVIKDNLESRLREE